VPLKRAVAVKVFSAPFGGTPEARREFADEWETLKKLQHPAIVRCYGGGFEQTDAYLAFELIAGETLAAQLERRTRLPWDAVLDFAEPLAAALEYLHRQPIVHGALQADKIMFAGFSPILIDVRVSRFATPYATNRPPTLQELAMRAPELSDDPSNLTPAADLYSLGAVLYLALTGRPPVSGQDIAEVAANGQREIPPSPASMVLDCPIWLDKLVMQLLDKNPLKRPPSAAAAVLALGEVRRRSLSRAGVAEHTSAGFSPLNTNDQQDRDEARLLLGHAGGRHEDKPQRGSAPWHEQPWLLVSGLLLIGGLLAYVFWPLNEDQMRAEAEALIAGETRSELYEAKAKYLEPMLQKFPTGKHASWAQEQIDRVEMLQAENALQIKLKRNLELKNEGERLYAEASEFEKFGDLAAALDRYQSMATLLADDPQYRPFVNLARRQIGKIAGQPPAGNEAATIIRGKLKLADQQAATGNVVAARQIWYSIVELYGNNQNVAPLVARAQQRLAAEQTVNPTP
jgi:hypothetical protein